MLTSHPLISSLDRSMLNIQDVNAQRGNCSFILGPRYEEYGLHSVNARQPSFLEVSELMNVRGLHSSCDI